VTRLKQEQVHCILSPHPSQRSKIGQNPGITWGRFLVDRKKDFDQS